MNKKQAKGFTLTELLVAVAIISIIASIAMPSFQEMIEKSKLKEAAESLKSDMMFARTEAIKRSVGVSVAVVENSTDWCYGINNDNTTCACGTANDCGIKSIAGSQFKGTTIGADYTTVFNFRRGTSTAGGVTISSSNYSARVKVSNRGRVTICSSDLGGYRAC